MQDFFKMSFNSASKRKKKEKKLRREGKAIVVNLQLNG